ncbi:MAG: glutathione-disulfide reductase [Alphaproteobacteria bacterium]|jgi:glutathione reductase (NADPH)|nr:glutathione-disulfide reductase [Alphaproteobacteria bacterium]MDP6589656.1 glutathione-disulfide reductase [Alphaproteobacteria bacterium]MDP6817511.1 glutathione-disulfide reductase [Alphaproteobacteria bacterium]
MADFDLFVIGGGSGGVACARRAASHGARVGLVEEGSMGGTCVHRGCIPKKFLVYASHFRHDFEDAAGYGWSVGESRFDWPTMVAAKSKELARLEGIYRRLLKESGVTAIDGRGALLDANSVAIGEERYSADTILIATGGWPFMPELPGIELAITSNEAFDLPRLPGRIVIVGGGYIACEFAGIFNGFGVETVQLYRSDMILRGFDMDIREICCDEMRKSGIDVRLNVNAVKLEKNADGIALTTTQGDVLEADQVLFATGRVPSTAAIGLNEAGVERNHKGAVSVDSGSRSNIASIYAVGDCTDRVNLTPVAIHEGRCLAETLFNDNPQIPDHRNIPTAIFTQPEIGTVGMSEEDARTHCAAVDIYKTRFRPLKHTLTGRGETVFMKLVVDRADDRVVGCHMIGSAASELSQLLGVAIKAGATKAQFDETVAVHPTTAEEFVTMYEPVGA